MLARVGACDARVRLRACLLAGVHRGRIPPTPVQSRAPHTTPHPAPPALPSDGVDAANSFNIPKGCETMADGLQWCQGLQWSLLPWVRDTNALGRFPGCSNPAGAGEWGRAGEGGGWGRAGGVREGRSVQGAPALPRTGPPLVRLHARTSPTPHPPPQCRLIQ